MHIRRSLLLLLLSLAGWVGLGVSLASDVIPSLSPEETSGVGAQVPTAAGRAREISARSVDAAQRLVAQVEQAIDGIRSDNRLAPVGRYLLALLGFIVIAWAILKNMLLKPGLPQLVADLVFPLLVLGMGVAAIEGHLGRVVASLVEELARVLGSSTQEQASASARLLRNIGRTIQSVWSSTPPGRMLDLDSGYLTAVLLQLVAVAFLALAGAIGLGVLFMAKLQLAVACMLGPVMIPWLLWKPAEFLFAGWLRFLIRGGFILVAVFAVENIMSSTMDNLSGITSNVDAGVDSALTYGMIALVAMLFAFVMLKSAEIGSGIVSGHVSGFGGFNAISQGGVARAVQGAAAAGGRQAARIGPQAGREGLRLGYAATAYATGRVHGRGALSAEQKAGQPARGTLARAAYTLGRRHSP